jgi:hypothetical protein
MISSTLSNNSLAMLTICELHVILILARTNTEQIMLPETGNATPKQSLSSPSTIQENHIKRRDDIQPMPNTK